MKDSRFFGPRASPMTFGARVMTLLGRSAACVVLLGGCYRYAPTNDAPGAGSEVRIHLTESGSASLAPVLGLGTTSVSGRVTSATESEVVMSVAETSGMRGRVTWAGERITIPRSALGSAEQRSLDRGRTVRAVAIGVGAAGAIALLVNTIASRAGGDGDGTVITPPET